MLRQRRSGVCLGLACLLVWHLAGCASYSAHDAAELRPEAMPYHGSDAALTLGADPYVQPERQQRVFGADLVAVAVIPVQVAVANNGNEPLPIEPDHFRLQWHDQQMTEHRPGHEVAKLLAPGEGVADYATTGIGMLGGLAGPIGAAAGRLVALLSAGALGQSRADAAQAREADYYRKELKATRLAGRQWVRGFLFFVLPRETPAFRDPILSLAVFREQQQIADIRLPLKGLVYPGAGARPNE